MQKLLLILTLVIITITSCRTEPVKPGEIYLYPHHWFSGNNPFERDTVIVHDVMDDYVQYYIVGYPDQKNSIELSTFKERYIKKLQLPDVGIDVFGKLVFKNTPDDSLIKSNIIRHGSLRTPTLNFHNVSNLIKTEHGWKGKYLAATRMKTKDGLCNIKFEEINVRGLIDRGEINDIIEKCNGQVLIGGFDGLSMVLFKGMDTKQKTDSTIMVVLPKLELWYNNNFKK